MPVTGAISSLQALVQAPFWRQSGGQKKARNSSAVFERHLQSSGASPGAICKRHLSFQAPLEEPFVVPFQARFKRHFSSAPKVPFQALIQRS